MKKRVFIKKSIIAAATFAMGVSLIAITPGVANAKNDDRPASLNYTPQALRDLGRPPFEIPENVRAEKLLYNELVSPYQMLYLYDFQANNKYDSHTSIMGLYSYLQKAKYGSELISDVQKLTEVPVKPITRDRVVTVSNNATVKLREDGTIPLRVGNKVYVDYGRYDTSCSYMGYHLITAISPQLSWKTTHDWYYDGEGFARYNGRYIIACTTTFGNVGDYVDFYLENGEIVKGIIGDIKDPRDNTWTVYGHRIGNVLNVIEFCVSPTWYAGAGHVNPGTASCHPEWGYKVLYAITLGEVDPAFSLSPVEIETGGETQPYSSDDYIETETAVYEETETVPPVETETVEEPSTEETSATEEPVSTEPQTETEPYIEPITTEPPSETAQEEETATSDVVITEDEQ